MLADRHPDPLSQVLALAGARCHLTGKLAAGGQWALRFPARGRLKIIAVRRGRCTFVSGGRSGEVRSGEAIVVNGAHPFVLHTDPDVLPVDAATMTVPDHRIGAADEFSGVGGEVTVEPGGEALLVRTLPPLLHISAANPQASAFGWLLPELETEMGRDRPGHGFARDQLAQLLLVQVLRAYLAQPNALPAGRLRVLADPRLAPAAQALHENPARPWQLDELARLAAMSRTGFASRFRAVAGVPPLAYLTEWRMRIAAYELTHYDTAVGELSSQLGYTSESAFIAAFKRAFGRTPLQHRRHPPDD
ncbi:AraC family transcriptional regulator [Saccharopolyspora sp. NFXS83]|uniref:AraC family transcriptional regulator n=1 Tax=Saccharopolyspora sp. NFXS83 TaxID=2993560 RepID=UPI00224A5F09|nr:AraC family transcriptional regulator [Saccharopolyspora sp. NFXS83]MCX2730809.1 AraC family transcriptional regulator [Saccharopolyspora sp. NFXS83]